MLIADQNGIKQAHTNRCSVSLDLFVDFVDHQLAQQARNGIGDPLKAEPRINTKRLQSNNTMKALLNKCLLDSFDCAIFYFGSFLKFEKLYRLKFKRNDFRQIFLFKLNNDANCFHSTSNSVMIIQKRAELNKTKWCTKFHCKYDRCNAFSINAISQIDLFQRN